MMFCLKKSKNSEEKSKKSIKNYIWLGLMILFMIIFLFSAVQLIRILWNYHKADVAADALMVYKPTLNVADEIGDIDLNKNVESEEEEEEEEEEPFVLPTENASLQEMIKTYPDVCAWVTLSGTILDYPVTQCDNNSYYVKHTVTGEETAYGNPFLDFRCENDFSGVNNILYGHNMKTGKMFATLARFKDEDYFKKHKYGVLYLKDTTYRLDIMACLLISAEDSTIYNPYVDYATFTSYVKENARYYRELTLNENDTFVTLSTCSYEFDNARTVVVAKIVKDEGTN